jgi:hypothetical protein
VGVCARFWSFTDWRSLVIVMLFANVSQKQWSKNMDYENELSRLYGGFSASELFRICNVERNHDATVP